MNTVSASLDIKQLVSCYKPAIETRLEQVLDQDVLLKANPEAQKLADAIKYSSVNGGKRLRAILALVSAEAVLQQSQANAGDNPALGLALAVELVHCASLIHDDLPCMDDDDLRRGKPSNHKVYGEANALLAGDYLLLYPLELIQKFTAAEFLQSTQVAYLEAVRSMILGQALDLDFSSRHDIDVEMIKQMESLKTGALIELAIVQGARLASASNKQIQALTHFAQNLGLAFQVTDDVLDFTASTEELGKTSQKDQAQNKFTYVREYGLDRAKQIAEDLIAEAKNLILDIDLYTDKLLLVADYVVSRNN